jgi:cytidine deaminase
MKFKIERLLDLATGAALTRVNYKSQHIVQHFRLGAAGIRNDGVIVVSYNGCQTAPNWRHHAESRLCRKLTPKSIVAVARVHADGSWAMAKPCKNCEICLRRIGVKRVYYTIAPNEFGTLIL